MKLELKTENESSSKKIFSISVGFVIISLIILISNISFKLGNVSRYYEINYLCRVLMFDKSPSNFKKLSNHTKLKSKQNIWQFCKDMIN